MLKKNISRIPKSSKKSCKKSQKLLVEVLDILLLTLVKNSSLKFGFKEWLASTDEILGHSCYTCHGSLDVLPNDMREFDRLRVQKVDKHSREIVYTAPPG